MKKIKILSFFLLVVFSIIISNKTSALSGKTYMDKAYLEGVSTCWTKYQKSPVATSDFPVFLSVRPDYIFTSNVNNVVLLPTDLTGVTDNALSCIELFTGFSWSIYGEFEGLLKMAGISQPGRNASDSEKTQFMKNIGYNTKSITNEDGKCASVNFKRVKDGDTSRTGTICLTNLNNDKITGSTKVELAEDTKGDMFTFQDSINFKKVDSGGGVEVSYTWYHENCQQTNIGKTCHGYVDQRVSKTFTVLDYKDETFQDFIDAIGVQFAQTKPSICAGGYAQQRVCFEYEIAYGSPYNYSSTGDTLVQYVVSDKTAATNSAIKYFSGSEDISNWSSLKYTNAEKVFLYQDYLTKVFEISFADDSCPDVDDSQETLLENSGYMKVKWNGSKTCYIKASNTNKEVVGIETDGDKKDHFGKKIKFNDLITILNSTTLTDEEIESLGDMSDGSNEDGEVEQTCANSGGAVSLGWIVCPILEWLGKAADDAYSNYVEPSLKIEPQLFSDNKDEGTLKAWSTFRDIANLLFVILLLVVIFSQLTGVGIDNYGIKKILPKIIVVAILVNLSYLICLICVDLSNILGNAFKALFDNLSTGTPTLNISDSNLNGSAVVATTLTGVAVLGALVLMVGAVWQNPAILLSLLVSALGVAIAVFFLFILLSARQAAVIVLTVISPLAFICYMLPNTKKLFDRWLKFGEGLLLVYPICGLLVGGGNYVSRLLLSAGFAQGGFISAFTAMIVGVLPIFFIPTVLKGAFAAMGNIGAAITGVGKNLQGRATRGMRNAEGYKTAQKRGLERRTRIKAGYNEKTGELTRGGRIKARFANTRFGRGIGYGKSQAGYIESAKKIAGENESASASLVTALSSADIAKRGGDVKGYYNDMLVKAGNTGNVSNVNAAIAAAVNSGQIKEKDIADMLRNALNDGNIKISNDGTMSNMLREMAAKYGSGFLSTDAELKSFMQKGGVDSGRKLALGGYGDYARAGNMDATDIKKEDINKLSGDSLSGLIRSGVLDQGMAQQMLAMNPNISNDKRIMLGAAANNLGGGMSVEDFKEAAKSIANNPADAGLISGMTETMAKALTSATPQSVNVVQNFQGGGRQIDSVDVKLR